MSFRINLIGKSVYTSLGWRLGPLIALTCLLLNLCVFSPELRGQAITGAIVGSVQDQSGLPIPGAELTVLNDALGTKVVKPADPTGHYLFTLLPPGSYTVEAVAKGFGQKTGHAVVQVDQTLRLDFSLTPATVKVTVEVTGTPPPVESVTSEMGQVVDRNTIQNLPLNGRIFSQLVALVPGAVVIGFSDFEENPAAAGAQTPTNPSVNGVNWSGNNYMIDGVPNDEPLNKYINISPPLDAIEEFKVQTLNPTAEYGAYGGAIINLTTRSGSNSYHGSLYEYDRNQAVEAADFFAHTAPALKLNQFGGSLGGPIIRDKTFFFMDAQGYTQRVAETTIATVPTPDERTGDLSADPNIIYNPSTGQPFPGNKITSLNPITAAVANLFPLPNLPGLANNFLGLTPLSANAESFDVRVDQYLRGNSRLFARDSMQMRQYDMASPANKFMYGGGDADSRNQNAVIGYNNAFSPNKALELRFGFNRYRNIFLGPDAGIDENNILGIPNGNTPGDPYTVGLAYFGMPGYLGTGSAYSGDGSNGTHRIVTEYVYTANYHWNIGRHALTMGEEALQIQQSLFGAPAPRGEFDFNANVTSNQGAVGTGDPLASFLLGYPADVENGYVYHRPWVRIWNFGTFIQDNYRVNNHLTLNLGLRWDLFTTPNEKFNDQSNFNLSTGLLDIAQPGNTGPNVNTDYHLFAPRIGLAYSPNRGTTAIRVAYGISNFSDNFGADGGTLEDGYPFTQTSYVQNPNIFVPTLNVSNGFPAYSPPVVNYTTVSPPPGFGVTTVAGNFRPDEIEMFNGGIQQQLSKNTVLDVSYVRTRGLHLYTSVNIDQPEPGPGSFPQRLLYYSVNPNVTSITYRASNGDSVYNALQVKLDKRFSFGLQALVSYAYSDTRNDFSYILDPHNNNLNWGPASDGFSTYDYPQNFVASYVYELPFGHGKPVGNSFSPAVDKLVSGWSVRGITTIHSGGPLVETVATSLLNTGGGNSANQTCSPVGTPHTVGEWFDTSCFAYPAAYQYGNARIGAVRGPGMFNWDMSLAKTVQLERISILLSGDFFNAWNHPEFGNPATTLGAPGFGEITSLAIPDRQIQFGLHLNF